MLYGMHKCPSESLIIYFFLTKTVCFLEQFETNTLFNMYEVLFSMKFAIITLSKHILFTLSLYDAILIQILVGNWYLLSKCNTFDAEASQNPTNFPWKSQKLLDVYFIIKQ